VAIPIERKVTVNDVDSISYWCTGSREIITAYVFVNGATAASPGKFINHPSE
jgi:hypothetical protein